MAIERKGIFHVKGTPTTLVGNPVAIGDRAPDATLTANDFSDVRLSKWADRVRVVSVVPSLDTAVCDRQTRRFNEEAATWGDRVAVLTISMDLPFTQTRWCGAADAKNVTTLSDHRSRDFGDRWGVYVKERGFLARSVFVIDTRGTVKHAQITREMGEEPNYEAVKETVMGLLRQD